ncbi:MAG: hypothetical protein CM15mV25_0890 [uncultured marine virus]|nr:MAG: hypothetical protein CM15mV25_0890 [uncultured marine virus]
MAWNMNNVHKIYQGHDKETNKSVIISTCNLYTINQKWLNSLDGNSDEAHLFKAVSLTKIMTKLEQCKYRVAYRYFRWYKNTQISIRRIVWEVNRVVSTSELQEKNN